MAVALLMFVLVTVLYMLALGRRCPLREVAPGVAVSLTAWMLLSLAFSYYVENLAHYTQLYGSIATIVVVLLWLYMSGTVLILGGELNAVGAAPAHPAPSCGRGKGGGKGCPADTAGSCGAEAFRGDAAAPTVTAA